MDNIIYTHHIHLNWRVKSTFQGEFYCEPNQIMFGSDVEECFSPTFYPIIWVNLSLNTLIPNLLIVGAEDKISEMDLELPVFVCKDEIFMIERHGGPLKVIHIV